jgi:hypothetical protein
VRESNEAVNLFNLAACSEKFGGLFDPVCWPFGVAFNADCCGFCALHNIKEQSSIKVNRFFIVFKKLKIN